MNFLLAMPEWINKYGFAIILIVVCIAMIVPAYIRQKKDSAARVELYDKLKKGTKIITTAGVYGVIESIENTTDGKVVTIITGNPKNPTTMTIHINAIGGIDNKSAVVEEENSAYTEVETVEPNVELESAEDIEQNKTTKSTTKKSTAKKTK